MTELDQSPKMCMLQTMSRPGDESCWLDESAIRSFLPCLRGYDDIYVGSGYDVMTDDVVPAPAPTEE